MCRVFSFSFPSLPPFISASINFSIFLRLARNYNTSSQAIALMSAEEALLRATFLERELWFRELRKMPAQTEEELEQLKLGMAVQIANSMHNEIFAIFMAKFIVLATKSVFCWTLHSRAQIPAKDSDSHPIQLSPSGTIATPSTRASSPLPFPLATSPSLCSSSSRWSSWSTFSLSTRS